MKYCFRFVAKLRIICEISKRFGQKVNNMVPFGYGHRKSLLSFQWGKVI